MARRLGVLTENPRPKGSGPCWWRPIRRVSRIDFAASGNRQPAGDWIAPDAVADCRLAETDMKALIRITLKNGVLDPQGKAIEGAVRGLGITGVGDVRQGKFIEVQLSETDEAKAKAVVEQMCKDLLANTVIENYAYDLVP